MEAELAQLKALNSDREACLAEYKSQIAEMLILNKEFSEKLRVCLFYFFYLSRLSGLLNLSLVECIYRSQG